MLLGARRSLLANCSDAARWQTATQNRPRTPQKTAELGRNKNPNYQPHRSVLRDAIYYTNGKNVYGTWRSGDIVFISSGKGVKTNLSRWDRLSADDAGAPR